MESKNEVLTLQQARKEAVKAQKNIESGIPALYVIFAFCIFGVFESAYMIGRKTMAADSIDIVWESAKKACPEEMSEIDI